MRIVSPVMKSLSSRASTALAISISPPQRPSGVASSTARDLFVARLRRREDRTWRDGVDENVVGGQLQRERFGERDHAGLGDVVRQVAVVARPAALRDPVTEVDDAAAALAAHVRAPPRARKETRRAGRR